MTSLASVVGAGRGGSWLDRLDPVVKLTWLVAVVVVAFATYHPLPLYAIALGGFVTAATAGVGERVARILLIFAPVTASILVIQSVAPAACQTACEPVARVGPLELYAEGTTHGLSLVGRLLAVETVALAVITTTHLSDLFAGFARLGMPYLANLMLSMTFQLIPILQREFEIVLAAQRARAMTARGFRAVLPSFVPVFAGAFERVQQVTIGLESRGFGSNPRPTSYRQPTQGRRTWLGAGLAAGVVGSVLGLTAWSRDQMPDVLLPAPVVVAVFILAATLFSAVIVAGFRSLARL